MANGQPEHPTPSAAAPSAPAPPAASPRGAAPGVTTRIIRDPQYGHLVEVHELPEQTPGLEPAAGRRAAERAGTTRPDSVQSP